MRRLSVSICPPRALGVLVLSGLLLAQAAAADLHAARPGFSGFRATCEDLGTFCFADGCGADQIDAEQKCRARCPSAAIMSVVPSACRRATPGAIVLRNRG
ncbi:MULTISPECIES: hypothetical protein [Methylobacterium]|uniref:Uncharacterized protein n=1 Tax=Methylobacterium longum TaxID=767694 RepID=A0ABT8AIA5_9HYPH|nr:MULTISPECIES: hypothetical protein [Methylobacterium]MCJ2100360.1 hypothetical protein [Methylobacterium sp. E-046]MDN3569567.1 hypothetical protein [Methylobacterium longum]GJE10786.1 hypothetical protein FOHLNKBM_1823 [Methylobacterium longum]